MDHRVADIDTVAGDHSDDTVETIALEDVSDDPAGGNSDE